jgi:transcriptional regulator with XRE-family HTH domain
MHLKEWREKRKLSQDFVAWQLGITQAHLSRVESGTRRPKDDLKKKIVALTRGKVSYKELVEWEEPG